MRLLRWFDVILAGVALLVLAPLLLAVSIILRLTGEGEVIYKQVRVGRNGDMFGLMKFATMLKDSPNIGAGELTVKGDPRILPAGRILRRTKINELPQLLNVLRGELSVVGPRPQVPSTFAQYPEEFRTEIVKVPPGLSGIGSIVFRDEERYLDSSDDPHAFYREVIIPYKASLEVWYAENRSVKLYLQVIVVTIWVIIHSRSRLPWRLWKNLPPLPDRLRDVGRA
jgi:lipopolysaccharide/colanic/teichoic acid biosynthesis glycosyltransferase